MCVPAVVLRVKGSSASWQPFSSVVSYLADMHPLAVFIFLNKSLFNKQFSNQNLHAALL